MLVRYPSAIPIVSQSLKTLADLGQVVSRETLDKCSLLGVKTLGYFESTVDRMVRNLMDGYMDQAEFIQVMEDLIEGQLTRAWMEGMAVNGFTSADMTPDLQSQLDSIISNEYASIGDFADYVIEVGGRTDISRKENLETLYSRADIWTNRYNDVVNQAIMASIDALHPMVWRLGNTEQHCATCAALDGIVATATAWIESGYKPQSPPNDLLECGGWRCDCRLEPTNEPVTEGGIPQV